MIGSPVAYSDARNLIKNGDLVYIAKGTSIWSKITEFVTGSPYYHCGIAFWIRDEAFSPHLMMLESHQGGRRIVTLSSYAEHPMDVVAAPIDWNQYCTDFIENTGIIQYSIREYIAIGFLEKLGIRLHIGKKQEVCSKMVALYLAQAGIDIEWNISPGKLFKRVIQLGFSHTLSIVPTKALPALQA